MWKTLLWNSFRHAFVIFTGFTALLHSTWTLATLFNGTEPPLSGGWLLWVIPAFVFALSIDVGQVWIAVEIRNGERGKAKYGAFAALALTTYYLQWFYLVAHFPDIPVSAGVSRAYLASVIPTRDAALWIVPGMLPLSTFLYTFSFKAVNRSKKQPGTSQPRFTGTTIETPPVPAVSSGDIPLLTESAPQADGTVKPSEMAETLLRQNLELWNKSVSELETMYPGVSRSTWYRAKKKLETK